jgi:UDP-glucose 4-epimerase
MTSRTGARTLVIGGGGLLGRSVAASTSGHPPAAPIRWADPVAAREDLATAVAGLAGMDEPLHIAWCAGSGIVGSDAELMKQETALLEVFLDELARRQIPVEALFFASSAGAVYAGTRQPVLNEESATAVTSPYGEWKLLQEELVAQWGASRATPTVIGRISNLYGPGQNFRKPQGLLSRLVRASLLRQPLTIYVDLDTRRDYIYAPDAGRVVAHALETAAVARPPVPIRIIASGRSVTVGELVSELGRIRKRRVPVVYARNALTEVQPRSLVFSSLYGDPVRRSPLTEGLGAVVADQIALLQAGQLG